MCGLIVITGDVSASPKLNALCERVGARGPHSHGWALLDHAGAWQFIYAPGPLSSIPAGDWALALGHSRLATSGRHPGSMPDPADGQPIVNEWIIAHNGTLPTSDEPDSASDSHCAASKIRTSADIAHRFTDPGGAAQAVLAVHPASRQLAVFRAGRLGGHPLFACDSGTTRIVASIKPSAICHLAPSGLTIYRY
jgi:hypothetical protein